MVIAEIDTAMDEATDALSVFESWSAVMCDVTSIAKGDFNDTQKFHFRGIDSVLDAVGPALRRHGVIVLPDKILEDREEEYTTGKFNTRMKNRIVKIQWRVYGLKGDSFTGESMGESADAGDKSATKAQSVAYRTFLTEALCIPTGQRDPDSDSHERNSDDGRVLTRDIRAAEAADRRLAQEVAEADEARAELLARTADYGWTEEMLVAEMWNRLKKNLRNTRDLALIRGFGDTLVAEAHPDSNPTSPEKVSTAQLKKLHTLLAKDGLEGAERVQWCSDMIGRTLESTKDLTVPEYDRLIEQLEP